MLEARDCFIVGTICGSGFKVTFQHAILDVFENVQIRADAVKRGSDGLMILYERRVEEKTLS